VPAASLVAPLGVELLADGAALAAAGPAPSPQPEGEAAYYAPTIPVVTPIPAARHTASRSASRPNTPAARTDGQGGTTVILQKQHLAVAAALFGLLVAAIGTLGLVVMRGNDATRQASQPPPSQPPAARPASAHLSSTTKEEAASVNGAQPAGSKPQVARAESASPGAASARRSRGARDMGLPPLTIAEVKILVTEQGRHRERDGTMTFASGLFTVAQKNGTVVHAVPYREIVSVSYSRSRQPLWQSPAGPMPVVRVGGGAFGFLRSDSSWLSVRTRGAFVIVRIEPAQARTIIGAFESRAGITVAVVRGK